MSVQSVTPLTYVLQQPFDLAMGRFVGTMLYVVVAFFDITVSL